MEYPEQVHATQLKLNDEDDPLAKSVLECAARLIEEWLTEGHRILVHCKASVSRSPATIMAYLIMYKGHDYDSAYDYISSRHGFIWPNPQYIAALKQMGRKN